MRYSLSTVNTLSKNPSSLKFNKFYSHIMALCLTFHIALGLSLRKTAQALKTLITFRSHLNRFQTTVKLQLSALNPLSILSTIKLIIPLLPMKLISKAVVLKAILGPSWMLQNAPFWVGLSSF